MAIPINKSGQSVTLLELYDSKRVYSCWDKKIALTLSNMASQASILHDKYDWCVKRKMQIAFNDCMLLRRIKVHKRKIVF